ncbi:MAG: HD domain-containing protein [Myxococcota bacterium]
MTASKHWYVADPIYQLVEFGSSGECVRALTAAPSFQRLRRISQLGLASFVFPGAVHTRFSHCLGAAHLASLVAEVLGDAIPPEHAKAIICSALLHDIGHGPFSHSFERALKAILGKRLKHEIWTRKVILDRLAPILAAHGVDADTVCELIKSQGSLRRLPAHLKEIISSQLDVDRMDYLCRDAHFTGVTVGQIDVQYLVRCLRIIQHGSQQTLRLTTKAVACYEAFAFARHVMNRTVYFHKQVATFECMMEECIRLLANDTSNKFLPEFFVNLHAHVSRSTTTTSDELIRHNINHATEDVAAVDEYLDSYLALTEDQIWTALSVRIGDSSPLSMLAQRLLERRPVRSHRIAAGKHSILESELKQGGFTIGQFCIRTMPSSLYEQNSEEQVFVQDDSSKLSVHISEKSSLLDALRDKPETDAILVIFDDDLRPKIEDVARQANCLMSLSERRSNRPGPSVAKTAPHEIERASSDVASSTGREG